MALFSKTIFMEIIENKLGAAVAYRSLTVWQEFSENRGIIKEKKHDGLPNDIIEIKDF